MTMTIRAALVRLAMAVAGALTLLTFAAPAAAQVPNGMSSASPPPAAADVPAASGALPDDKKAPLEPFLFSVILAGGGIVGVAFAVVTDRRIRASAGNIEQQRRYW